MFHRITGLLSLALLVPALYWTVRLEHADRLFVKGDPASIRQAVSLAPGNAEYASLLAQVEPDRADSFFKAAIALNPRDASLRVELGLAAEQRGDFRDAEASLLEAMRLDGGFGPRWALSDFYFHRHDAEKFWPVTKAALAKSSGDVSDQFRNCWALSADAQTILERAIPDRPAVLRKYLDFLLGEGKLDAAEPVAVRVLASADNEAVPSLLNYCDRMLNKWRGEEALVVWNGLAKRKLAVQSGRGFDWQIATPEGIQADRTATGLIVNFSGEQTESVELLAQFVPLLRHRRYILTVRYRVAGIGAESGLFSVLQSADGRDLLRGRGLLPGGDGIMERNFPLETPDDVTLGHLVLGYRRALGTTRIEGTLTLEKLALTPVGER
jgi:tetratricopeptide (TPR) repeat protein